MGDYLATTTTYQDFYLGELDVSANSALAQLAGATTSVFTADATVDVSSVTVSTMRNLFTFGTDSIDIDDIISSDLLYRVNWTDNSNNPLGIDIDTLSLVSASAIDSAAANKNMTYDYVRYLALKLFNTANGVDLFSNEASLRSTLKNNFGVALSDRLVYLSGLGSQDDDDTSNNPSRSVLRQIINTDAGRFQDISGNLYYGPGTDANGDAISFYSVPFVAGDKVYFKVTVHADPTQHTIVNRSVAVESRSYLVRITLTA
jgi:hypothetical protein